MRSFPKKLTKAEYIDWLRKGFGSEKQFEAMQANRIRREKINDLIYENVRPSMHELYEEYIAVTQQMELNYCTFSQWPIPANIEATTETMKQYLADNPEEFRKPDQSNFDVVVLRHSDIFKNIEIPEPQKRAYYAKNAKPGNAQFWNKGRIEYSHILRKVDYGTTATQKAEIEAQARKLLLEVTKDNFAEMAKKHSQDDFSKNNGGSLKPDIEPNQPSIYGTTVTLAIRSMAVDEIKLVESVAGYHIIQVTKIVKDGAIPYAELRNKKDSFNSLKTDIANRKLHDYLEAMNTAWDEVTDLKSLADALNQKIAEDAQLKNLTVKVEKSGWVEERPTNMYDLGQISFNEAQQTSFFDLKIGAIAGPLFAERWGLVAELKEKTRIAHSKI